MKIVSLSRILLVVALLAGARSAQATCFGDCTGDNDVTVDDLLIGVNVALGSAPLSQCSSLDANLDGEVTVDELLQAVATAQEGCSAAPTSTPTPSPTPVIVDPVSERSSLFLRCPTFGDGSVGFCHYLTSRNPMFQPFVLPQSIQLDHFFVYCDFPVTQGTQAFTLHINGTDTPLGCSIGEGQQTCSDTDPSHGAAYTRDDLISVKVAGSPGAESPICRVSMSVRLDAEREADAIFTWNNVSSDYTPFQDHYCGPGAGLTNDPSACGVTTPEDAGWSIGSPGRISGMTVRTDLKLTLGTSETFVICKLGVGNGSCDSVENGLTDVTVTIDNATQQQTHTTCTQNCSVSAGDRLAVKVHQVIGTPGPKKWHFAVTVDGVPAHLAFTGDRRPGERYYNQMTNAPALRSTLYRIDRPGRLRNLYCHTGTPTTGNTVFSVCAGTTDAPACGALACTIGPNERSCNDAIRSIAVAAGDYVAFRITHSGGNGWHGCSLEIAP